MHRCATNTTGDLMKREGDGVVKIKVNYTDDSDLEFIRRNLAPKIVAFKPVKGQNDKGIRRAYIWLK